MTKFKHEAPAPDYPFAYRILPERSGNEINGLGVHEAFRPEQVFHNTGRGAGRKDIDWAAMDMFFNMTNPWPMFWQNLKALWQRRLAAGPVKVAPVEVSDPNEMSEQIKQKARALGADLVGITHYDESTQLKNISFDYQYAICLGLAMDREEMLHAPYRRASTEVMRTYRRCSQLANKLAEYIRTLGWQAEGYGVGEDIMQIPMAINAGLGQLGKHGSMISREHGSNFRLSLVLTDLPMKSDKPVDIGVDDLCVNCQRCTLDCPPDAIHSEKQWVRGVKKWYVDFDKCIPYFTHTSGCGICIETCPWSEPGRGISLSKKLLAKRQKPER